MGRPRSFEREDVLDRAIEAFWCRGYEATSIQDLVAEMGINRGSLYATFGDKHALFLAAIERYYGRALAATCSDLKSAERASDGIQLAIRSLATGTTRDRRRRGCLMTNSAVELAPHCRDTAKTVAEYYRRTEDAFFDALVRARAQGDLNSPQSDRSLARFITCTLQGLQVVSKVSSDRQAIDDIIGVLFAALGSARPRISRTA
jgi:TetR/AcrR family transcriptional repressor of nem operon